MNCSKQWALSFLCFFRNGYFKISCTKKNCSLVNGSILSAFRGKCFLLSCLHVPFKSIGNFFSFYMRLEFILEIAQTLNCASAALTIETPLDSMPPWTHLKMARHFSDNLETLLRPFNIKVSFSISTEASNRPFLERRIFRSLPDRFSLKTDVT